MEVKEIKDKSGHILRVKHYDGYDFSMHFIGNVVDHMDNLKKLPYKEGDVLVWSLAKSGTHWLYEVARMLKLGTTEYAKGVMEILEFRDMDVFHEMQEPRVMSTHLPFRYFPEAFLKQRGKILHIYRNPKDVFVSHYNFLKGFKDSATFKGNWEDFFDLSIKETVRGHSWRDFSKDVEKFMMENPDYPILTLCYEDLKKNLPKEVRKIVDFLELDLEESFIDSVTRKCEGRKMIAAKSSDVPKMIADMSHDGSSNVVFRKGEVGDWKNWFTVAQNEQFDTKYGPAISRSKWPIHFTIKP